MSYKKSTMILLGVLFCALTSFHAGGPRPAAKKATARRGVRTIIIDPGHGGFDTGTKGLFSTEANVALSISMKLGALIAETFPDMKIVYTRTTDVMPGGGNTIASGLNYRAELANRSRGDLFIALHCDNDGHPAGPYTVRRLIGHRYAGKGKHRHRVPIYETYEGHHTRAGTEAFIWKADRGGFKSQAINDRGEGELADSSGESNSDSAAFDMNSPEAIMRAQLYEQKYFANSALFATLVEDEFAKAGRTAEGVFQRDEGIRVLQATGMPSVLVEMGFLSNVEEEKYLNSEEGQNEIAHNLLEALKRYQATLEGHPINTADSTTTGTGNQ
ncbi:MAG TPA: N-acetylmuramoyl-L-alanine amidase [Puia sp.]|nr:N-acetylmuramoyl-L-alanine amidase [Puia sp.]